MTSRIIVAVNAILVVGLHQEGVEFLQDTLEHRIQQLLANLHNPSTDADSQAGCTLMQCLIGQDLDDESALHCHLKMACSSREQTLDAIDKIQPIFFQHSGNEILLSATPTHPSSPLSCEPPIEWNAWMVAPQSSDCLANPKAIPPDTTALFCMNANLHIQPNHREELLSLLEQARSESIKEPLCIEYQYGESLSTPNTFHVHQEYSGNDGGEEGFDQHAKTPHYQTWKEFANDEDRFSKEPEGYTFRREMPSKSDMAEEQNSHDNNNDCILLDGGTGHELKQRGVISDGSFLAGLLANERQPDVVQSVHWDFVHYGGCRVLTTNSFVAVPERIQQDILMTADASTTVSQDIVHRRTRELIVAAVKCARIVANKHHGVQVAGTVPPLTECYRASLVPTDPNDMIPIYKFLLTTLIQAGVDILLAETLSTSREAIAIVRALSELKQDESTDCNAHTVPPLWIALTIHDFQEPTMLRSGETLDEALDSILKEATAKNILVGAIGVNCASPSAVTRAIPLLLASTKKTHQRPMPRVLVYANAFRTTTSEWLASVAEESGDKNDKHNLHANSATSSPTENQIGEYDSEGILLPEAYGHYAKEWQTLGASIIGGCCGCSHIHLKAVADKLGLNS